MLDAFAGRIINIHPSLLPKFPGIAAWKQALEAGEAAAGCTVHYVDAGMDSGEIIAQSEVPILAGDTPETLHARIQVAEHELYPEVIRGFASRRSGSLIGKIADGQDIEPLFAEPPAFMRKFADLKFVAGAWR